MDKNRVYLCSLVLIAAATYAAAHAAQLSL